MINNKNDKEKSDFLFENNVDYPRIFRQNILLYAEKAGLSIAEVANQSRIPINTINSFLHHVSNDMKVSNATRIAKTLNISIDELVGANTLPEPTKESIQMCRELSGNDLRLIHWFIRYLYSQDQRNEPNRRYVSVMMLGMDNDGNLKITSEYERFEITDLTEPLKSKVFFGIKLNCDNYMPTYLPNDILLIANDRPPKSNEHALVRTGKYLFIIRRVVENGIAKYYSIRDGKYRIDETDVDELIGYVADTKNI